VGSDEDVDLAWRIENRLAEFSGGYTTESDVLTALRDDAQAFGVVSDAPSLSSAAAR
jgi:hypothetical protein